MTKKEAEVRNVGVYYNPCKRKKNMDETGLLARTSQRKNERLSSVVH